MVGEKMKEYRKFGNCPVCLLECKIDEDIVVCPECGAPYHRNCYKTTGKCLFEEQHSEDFSYADFEAKNNNADTQNATDISQKCPRCFAENSSDSLFCNKCGYPIAQEETTTETVSETPLVLPFDPLFGMNKDEPINDIKISDFAQYVRGNIFYYISVFRNIFQKNKSRFNFTAFLFSGAWFLYRKMYRIGIALTALIIFLSIFSTYIEFTYVSDVLKSVGITSAYELYHANLFLDKLSALPLEKQFILFLPSLTTFAEFIIMLISGFVANKVYYKNCCTKIKKIKTLCKNDSKLYNDEINKFGGVNLKIIPFVFLCYIIIEYLPRFLI